jgi:hypothetical protein
MFLLPPPGASSQDNHVWLRFAQLVITVVIGFILLASLRWSQKEHAAWWAGVSLLFLLLSAGVFFVYQTCAARWSATYNGQSVLIGDTLTSFGREYRQEKPELSNEQLVMDVSGQIEKIWTKESLESRRSRLAALYVVAMPLFTICILSIVQALQCAAGKARVSRTQEADSDAPARSARSGRPARRIKRT